MVRNESAVLRNGSKLLGNDSARYRYKRLGTAPIRRYTALQGVGTVQIQTTLHGTDTNDSARYRYKRLYTVQIQTAKLDQCKDLTGL